jgi:hypothetical protein
MATGAVSVEAHRERTDVYFALNNIVLWDSSKSPSCAYDGQKEVARWKPTVPTAVPHRALVTSEYQYLKSHHIM